mgnify:CR=1 FL=1
MALDPSANTCKIYWGSKAFPTFGNSVAFEKSLDALMAQYNFERMGSGQNMVTGVRDIEYVAVPIVEVVT